VDRNGRAVLVTFGEIVALQEPRHRVLGAQADHALEAQGVQPLAVETDFGLLGIQDLENLRAVGLRILQDFVLRERRPGEVAAGGIADAGRAIPMTKITV